jgi:rare lipoprotein A
MRAPLPSHRYRVHRARARSRAVLRLCVVLCAGFGAGCAHGATGDARADAVRESRAWEAREASGGGADEPGPSAQGDGEPDADALRVLDGKASYYADSLAGNHTASGERYRPGKLTAANRDLAFGTVVRVVRKDNGRSVTVRINDRGPFGDKRRIIDVSRAAAEKLDMIRAGVVDVRVEILEEP